MKLKLPTLLDRCIGDGIRDALTCQDDSWDQDRQLDHISEYIWLQLDYYFDFEDN